MGSPCLRFRATNLFPLAFCNFLLGLLKDIIFLVLSCNPLQNKALSDKHTNDSQFHPSPSLAPVPLHCVTGMIKDRVPVLEYYSGLGARRVDSVCVVCLESMKASDEVRELCNCCHVFHRVCLDAWIDQDQVTCPICRAKLLPSQGDDALKCGGDPWRRERMIYLFGEDYVFGTS